MWSRVIRDKYVYAKRMALNFTDHIVKHRSRYPSFSVSFLPSVFTVWYLTDRYLHRCLLYPCNLRYRLQRKTERQLRFPLFERAFHLRIWRNNIFAFTLIIRSDGRDCRSLSYKFRVHRISDTPLINIFRYIIPQREMFNFSPWKGVGGGVRKQRNELYIKEESFVRDENVLPLWRSPTSRLHVEARK